MKQKKIKASSPENLAKISEVLSKHFGERLLPNYPNPRTDGLIPYDLPPVSYEKMVTFNLYVGCEKTVELYNALRDIKTVAGFPVKEVDYDFIDENGSKKYPDGVGVVSVSLGHYNPARHLV